ncbi:MAG: hypothetical protein N3G22_04550 [Candidatus Micrarchaeota archaeon]|nr:hypothetical protein [Candidatus Micrarchaeota archaeon]
MAEFDFWKNEFVDAARFAFGARLLVTILTIALSLFFALVLKIEFDLVYVSIAIFLLTSIGYAYAGYRAVSKLKFSPLKGALAVFTGALFAASILSWNGNLAVYAISLAAESLPAAVVGFLGALLAAYWNRK